MLSELNQWLAILAFVIAPVTAGLQIMGAISVNLARLLFVFAWVLGVAAACGTLNNAPPKHLAIMAVFVGVPLALLLLLIERWAVKRVRKLSASPLDNPVGETYNSAPNIVCLDSTDLFLELDTHGVFRETRNHGAGVFRPASVKFINEPKPGHMVGSISNIRAQIIFYRCDWPEREEYRVDYGCWLNEKSPYVSFNLSDNAVHHLIVGVFQRKRDGSDGFEPEFTVYGNSPDRNIPLPEYATRYPDRYKVKVLLIAAEQGGLISQHDFELEFESGSSFSFGHITEEEKQKRGESFTRELKKFIDEGKRFLDKPTKTTDWDKLYADAYEWHATVYKFIRRVHGALVAERFDSVSKLKPYPHKVHEGHRDYLDKLYTRFENLKELAREYGTGQQPVKSELIVDQLSEFLNEGSQILKRLEARRVTVPYKEQAEEWAEKVTEYLYDNNMKSRAIRFSNEAITDIYPKEATPNTRELFNWLYTRIVLLEEFIKELD